MSEENKESPIVPVSMDSWVEWFRSVAPHIHSIRGKTIVIDLAGETILQEHFSSLIADISMISRSAHESSWFTAFGPKWKS